MTDHTRRKFLKLSINFVFGLPFLLLRLPARLRPAIRRVLTRKRPPRFLRRQQVRMSAVGDTVIGGKI